MCHRVSLDREVLGAVVYYFNDFETIVFNFPARRSTAAEMSHARAGLMMRTERQKPTRW
jgi:hypothetical protein